MEDENFHRQPSPGHPIRSMSAHDKENSEAAALNDAMSNTIPEETNNQSKSPTIFPGASVSSFSSDRANFNENTAEKTQGKRTKEMPLPQVVPYGATSTDWMHSRDAHENTAKFTFIDPNKKTASLTPMPSTGHGATNNLNKGSTHRSRSHLSRLRSLQSRRAHRSTNNSNPIQSSSFPQNIPNLTSAADNSQQVRHLSNEQTHSLPHQNLSHPDLAPDSKQNTFKEQANSMISTNTQENEKLASTLPKQNFPPQAAPSASTNSMATSSSDLFSFATPAESFSLSQIISSQNECKGAIADYPNISLNKTESVKVKAVVQFTGLDENDVTNIAKSFKHRGLQIDTANLMDECDTKLKQRTNNNEMYYTQITQDDRDTPSSHPQGTSRQSSSKGQMRYSSLPPQCETALSATEATGIDQTNGESFDKQNGIVISTPVSTESSAKDTEASEGSKDVPILQDRSKSIDKDTVDGAAFSTAKSCIKAEHDTTPSTRAPNTLPSKRTNQRDNISNTQRTSAQVRNNLPTTTTKQRDTLSDTQSISTQTSNPSSTMATKRTDTATLCNTQGAQAFGATASVVRCASEGHEERSMNANTSILLKLVRKENEMLEMKKKCTECNSQARDITFLPCGHYITCRACAEPLYHCPQCKHAILATVNTFLS